jgi:DNA-binding response OmpR family regulator
MMIAAMTAHAMAEDRERCLEAGMDSYITKPLQIAQLAKVLRRAADAASGGAPPVPEAGPREPAGAMTSSAPQAELP